MHAVAPVQLMPPHCPYTDCVEPPPAPSLVLGVVLAGRVVRVFSGVGISDLIIVGVTLELGDVSVREDDGRSLDALVVSATELVTGAVPSAPVTGVPDAVMLEDDCLIETAPLYIVGPGTV